MFVPDTPFLVTIYDNMTLVHLKVSYYRAPHFIYSNDRKLSSCEP